MSASMVESTIRRVRVGMIAAVFGSLVLTLAVATPVTADQSPVDLEIRVEQDPDLLAQAGELAVRATKGEITDEDRVWLAREPELAALIVDPSRTTVSASVTTPPAPLKEGEESITAVTCKATDRYSNWYSFTGGLVYRYHSRTNYCYTGISVSLSNNYGYFSDVDPLYDIVNANIVNSVNPSGTSKILHTQGHIRACVGGGGVGCFANYYPWGKVKITAAGVASFTSGE